MSEASRRRTAGVLVVDKPQGPTSHDVVARVRRALGTREVGHAGTLDPMATGVLVVAVGEATKLVPWLTAARKHYRTTLALGVETDTLDAMGRVTRSVAVGDDLRAELARGIQPGLLAEALRGERARTAQVPPAFSAVHTGGERAYDRARRGESVVLEPREVAVFELALVACSPDPPSVTLDVEASKGFYVRSLARDLAASLGTVGHLTALRRTRSGTFDAEGAVLLSASPEELASRLVHLADAAARVLPVARLTEAGADHARNGRRVPAAEIECASADLPSAWLDPTGALVAVGEVDGAGNGRVVRGFARG